MKRNKQNVLSIVILSILLVVFLNTVVFAQEPIHTAFKLRTITAGVNVTVDNYREVLEETKVFLEKAKDIMVREGFARPGARIATQPHAYYLKGLSVEESYAIVKDMRTIATGYLFNVGPGIVDDVYDQEAIDKILAFTDIGASRTIIIASKENGIHWNAIKAAAEVIKKASLMEIGGRVGGTLANNSIFGALGNVDSEVPFFPGAYHNRSYNSFSIGTESASLFMKVFSEVNSMQEAEKALLEEYEREIKFVEAAAFKIEKETGWKFQGIDTTPAQMGEISIGKAVEDLIKAPFGTPGTLAACAIMTSVIKNVDVKQIGYRGLFLPPMEDNVLAARAYDYYNLDSLLAYSAVCGTGLDVLALPGDITNFELEKILLDVAFLSLKLDKPLTARLMPFVGRKEGELVDTKEETGNYAAMKVLKVR